MTDVYEGEEGCQSHQGMQGNNLMAPGTPPPL